MAVPARELDWGRCVCGRKLYEHSRRRVPNAGNLEYVCGRSPTGRFESETPDVMYDPGNGLLPRPGDEPTTTAAPS